MTTLYEAAIEYVDAHRSGPTERIAKAADALQGVIDRAVAERVREIAMTLAQVAKSRLNEAVNTACTCGGRGPNEDPCPACSVWHMVNR